MRKEEMFEMVVEAKERIITIWKMVYTFVMTFLTNDVSNGSPDVEIALNIIDNVKRAKDKAELEWHMETSTTASWKRDANKEHTYNLCCQYVKLYRVLDLLRVTCIYISSQAGIRTSIETLQDEIEDMLFMNNRELWLSIQKSSDMHQRVVGDLKNSLILRRYITQPDDDGITEVHSNEGVLSSGISF